MKNKCITVMFILMIFGISICSMIKKDKLFSERENRYLTSAPKLQLEAIENGEFEKAYEEYLSDQFVARDTWVTVKTAADLLLGKRDINGVYFCKDNYLIEKQEEKDYTSESAKSNYEYLENFVKTYEEDMNIKVMLVPTASEILDEKLPKFAYNQSETDIIDDVYAKIGEEHSISIIDTLRKHSSEYIYYRTDHHWTTLGAYYAYVEYAKKAALRVKKEDEFIREKVSADFYGTISAKVGVENKPDDVYVYRLKTECPVQIIYNNLVTDVRDTLYYMDALSSRDKYSVFLGGNNELLQMSTASDSDRKLLIIKDSYSHCFIPFIADDFNRIDVVDLRYYNESVNELINNGGYSDVLVLYSIYNLATDRNIFKMMY